MYVKLTPRQHNLVNKLYGHFAVTSQTIPLSCQRKDQIENDQMLKF